MGQIDLVTNQQSTLKHCVNFDDDNNQGTKEIYVLPELTSVEEIQVRLLDISYDCDENIYK